MFSTTSLISLEIKNIVKKKKKKICSKNFNFLLDYTHQFFFQNKCTYVLLMKLNCDNVIEDNNIAYWLNFLESRTKGEIKLVLVGTHADLLTNKEIQIKKERLKKEIKEMIEKYQLKIEIELESHIFFIGTTAKVYKRDLNNLKTFLKKEIGKGNKQLLLNQKHKKVFEITKTLSKAENYEGKSISVPFVSFQDIFKQWNIENPKDKIERRELENLLEDLSSLGSIIYFKESKSGLSDFVITDPKWLNKFFLQIVSMENKDNFFVFWEKLWILLRDNTFDNFFMFKEGDKIVQFIKQMLIDFDLLLPMIKHHLIYYPPLELSSLSSSFGSSNKREIKECYIVPILLKPKKESTHPIFYNKEEKKIEILSNSLSFCSVYNDSPSQLALKFNFNFKPPGLLQRVMMRLRNMIDLKENLQNLVISPVFGIIDKEIIWQHGYQVEFQFWSLLCLVQQIQNNPKTESDRDSSTNSHVLKIILKTKELKKNCYYSSNLKEYLLFKKFFDEISETVKVFMKNSFSSLTSMNDKRSGKTIKNRFFNNKKKNI